MSLQTTLWKFFIENLQQPYPITQLEINPKFIHEFFFVENLQNKFLTAELLLDDKNGFLETIQITGKEQIRVTIEQDLQEPNTSSPTTTTNITKILLFDIYNIKIEIPTIGQNLFRIFLVQAGALDTWFGSHYSVGFSNKLVSDIVQVIFEKQLGLTSNEYIIEPTADKLTNYVIPYLHPIEAIRQIVKKARRSVVPHEGGYVCFTSTGGKNTVSPIIKFVSFSSLIDKTKPSSNNDIYSFRNQNANQYFINTFKEVGNIDYFKQRIKLNGIGGQTFYGVNYNEDKNIINISETYSDFINKTVLMGKVAYFDTSIDNPIDHIEFYGGEKQTVQARLDYTLRMLLASYNRREVIMEGALYRYAGQSIFVSEMSLNPSDIHNTQDYGWWLIKGITHYYALGVYTQKVTIIKDSYAESSRTHEQEKIISV